MDSNPLAPEAELIISNHKEAFVFGLRIVAQINQGKVYVCTRNDSRVPGNEIDDVHFESFSGPHPAGLPGTHIHRLDPVNADHIAWTIGYQDVIAWGHLFLTGEIMSEKTVSLGGPVVKTPQLYTTYRGANLLDFSATHIDSHNIRIIPGSVLVVRIEVDVV